MDDIVKRLRKLADRERPYGSLPDVLDEAAARIEQLEAEAKTRTLDYLGQVGQLSEELERTKREAERAQDAHGVRFLNYLEETARLTDRIEQLEAALRDALSYSTIGDMPVTIYDNARAALGKKA